MGEYEHIQRQIKRIEAEQRAAVAELIAASQQLVTRVRLDFLPRKFMGWGGGTIERVERAIKTLSAKERSR